MVRVLFLDLLNHSIAVGWLIALILLLRVLPCRFPRWILCLMWGIVGIRLVLPFSFESSFSLIPSAKTVEPSIDLGRMVIQTGFEKIDASANLFLDRQFDASEVLPKVWYDSAMQICSRIWIAGVVLLAVYNIVTEIRLHNKLSASLCCGGNVYISDNIASPFVLGVLKPRIYLPSAMEQAQVHSVLLHERAHITRLDPLWKKLGFILACIYWFNPLVWIAYIVFSRDIELACDERVIRSMDNDEKQEYALTLLHCSIRRRTIAMRPVAFGEVGVKRRIQSIAWFKKSSQRTIAAALLLCAMLAIGFLSSPVDSAYGYDTFSRTYGFEPKYTLSRCDCKNSQVEIGEYFYPQDSEILTECEFCTYSQYSTCFHVHEYGEVKSVGRCTNCEEVIYTYTLYEGYRCLSASGEFVKTE